MIPSLPTRRLIVCVGPGGVGKTTLAAALAVEAARSGKRVAVITIDPAKRLADALGLDGLDDALRPVSLVSFGREAAGPGRLLAAMLDTKASYDALIARIADPETAARILENRVYRSFSASLARSHAYIAMERLHDALGSAEHDLVILDTPPTRSALDILDAPGRLARFLDERVVDAFVGDAFVGGRGAAAWLRQKSAGVAIRLFGALVGDNLMGELASFFEVFFPLRHGFAARAAAVSAALIAEDTGFVLVTTPERTHLSDARYLREGLLQRGIRLDATFVNRAFHPGLDGRPLGEGGAGRLPDERLAVSAARLRGEQRAENRVRLDAITEFVDRETPQFSFPIFDEEPANLTALVALLSSAIT